MPEILPDHVPSPRTPLVWDGTRYRAVRGHTDGTVQVRGEDQLFSIEKVVAQRVTAAISGPDGFVASLGCPAGRYWVITNVAAQDATSASTARHLTTVHDGTGIVFDAHRVAIAAGEWLAWHGHVFLDAEDVIRAYFIGGLAGDTCTIDITGYQMTIET